MLSFLCWFLSDVTFRNENQFEQKGSGGGRVGSCMALTRTDFSKDKGPATTGAGTGRARERKGHFILSLTSTGEEMEGEGQLPFRHGMGMWGTRRFPKEGVRLLCPLGGGGGSSLHDSLDWLP